MPSVAGAGSILLLILTRPDGRSQRMSHHSGWFSKVGLVTPAMKPGTLRRSSILVRSVYGNACRVNPRSTPPEARAHAARTASATSPEGRLWPRKMTRFCVRRAFASTMMGCVDGPLVVRWGWGGKGCGDLVCGSEKFWMSLMREKSPTDSGITATGTLIGIGMPLYMTLLSNSCVSRGTEYWAVPSRNAFVPARYICGRGVGCSRWPSADWWFSSIRIWTIFSNFWTNKSLFSLDCNNCLSRYVNLGMRDKSMALTAS